MSVTEISQRRRRRYYLPLGLALVGFALVGFVKLIALPVIDVAREPALRTSCIGQNKIMMLSLHTYYDLHLRFPPAHSIGKDGKPAHSWRTIMLPFSGSDELYNRIRADEPWG